MNMIEKEFPLPNLPVVIPLESNQKNLGSDTISPIELITSYRLLKESES
jgi:hypothetical protein